MSRIASIPPGSVGPVGDDGAGPPVQGSTITLSDVNPKTGVGSVTALSAIELLGHDIGAMSYHPEFAPDFIHGVRHDPSKALNLLDSDFPHVGFGHGQTNRPSVRDAFIQGVDDTYGEGDGYEQFAQLLGQPPLSPDVSHAAAVEKRLATWTEGMTADQANSLRRAVYARQPQLQPPEEPPSTASLASRLPGLSPQASLMLANAGIFRY